VFRAAMLAAVDLPTRQHIQDELELLEFSERGGEKTGVMFHTHSA